MNKNAQRIIEVWADWALLGGPTFMGTLFATPVRGKEMFSFEYDSDWLAVLVHDRFRFRTPGFPPKRARRSGSGHEQERPTHY